MSLNPYKLRRIWSRRFQVIKKELIPKAGDISSRHDYAWKKRKDNPFRAANSEAGNFSNIKRPLLFILGICFFTLSCFLLLSHPFFHVTDVQVKGLIRIADVNIEETVFGILQEKKLFFFPRTNFFLLNQSEIEEILLARYPLNQVVVAKEFPNTVHIIAEEKVPIALFDNEKQYFYLDKDGRVIEPLRHVAEDEWVIHTEIVTSTRMVTSTREETGDAVLVAREVREEKEISRSHTPPKKKLTAEFGAYPIIYDVRGKYAEVNHIILEPMFLKTGVSWLYLLSTYTDIPVSYLLVENALGDARIKTGEGWDILVRLTIDPDTLFDEFQLLFNDQINRNTIQYVNLKYSGRIYWQ